MDPACLLPQQDAPLHPRTKKVIVSFNAAIKNTNIPNRQKPTIRK